MPAFRQHLFSPEDCARDLECFGKLLDAKAELEERDDILPFFQEAPDLALHIASVLGVGAYDQVASELSLAGAFRVDLAAGSSQSGRFVLIEFEDAKASSIFRRSTRDTAEWSPRFLGGLAQLSDWFWKVDDLQGSDTLLQIFGRREVEILPVLVIGRESNLDPAQRARLDCLCQRMLNRAVSIYTFDRLLADLRRSYAMYNPW